MNHGIRPEQKTGIGATGPPIKYTVPPPKDPARCVGCPYPGVGFICWSQDGSCLRTDADRIGRRANGR